MKMKMRRRLEEGLLFGEGEGEDAVFVGSHGLGAVDEELGHLEVLLEAPGEPLLPQHPIEVVLHPSAPSAHTPPHRTAHTSPHTPDRTHAIARTAQEAERTSRAVSRTASSAFCLLLPIR